MTTGSRPETASSSGGDIAVLSPVSSTSSHPSSSSHSHSHGTNNLPVPPPPERQASGKGRSAGPSGSQRFKVLGRKGKDKRRSIGGFEDDEDDWTLEGMNGDKAGVTARHGLETHISPPSPTKEDPSRTKLVEEPSSTPALSESQLTEVPAKNKKSRGRGLVKKTSRMFSRDKDKEAPVVTPGNPSSSLGPNKASRQSSYSSANSIDSAVTSSSTASNRAPSTARNGNGTGNKSSHLRRLSQDSQFSRQAQGSIRSGVMSIRETSDEGKRSSSNGLSASVPSLNRHALPQPGSSSRTGQDSTIPSRMSSWITNFLPVSTTSNETTTSAPAEPPVTSSPARKGPSAAANFLYAARQKAVDGMRQLLDTEATPDKSPDTIWVMGVGHPGYRPSTPSESPTALVGGDVPTEFLTQRRESSSSGKASPPIKSEQANLRPAVWPKRKDPGQASSPPPKSFGSIFSTSTLSLALPNSSSSPNKDTDARSTPLDSPSKGKRKEKEIIRWPEQFHNDFRTIVWCTYRAQYAPIVSLPGRLLVPTPEAYYSAFAPPLDATTNDLPRPKPSTSMSLPNRPSTSPWAWARSGEERGLTSDAGWGCMLRTGQSMLANALVHLHLGRDWRVPTSKPDTENSSQSALDELEDYATYVRLLSWFLDDPSPLCPFSVHRMALIGKELGKEVGEWFGPSTAAGALKTLTNSFSPCGLAVATATDSMIYKSDVYAASNLPSTGWFDDDSESTPTTLPTAASKRSSSERGKVWGDKAVLILVGLRLGLDGVNPIYYDSIKALFTFPQSVGIAGGRPSSSYYFVASQANSLFYLDPHLTRPAVPLETPPAPSHRTPLKPRTRRQPASTTDDVDELVLIESPSKKSTNPKASSGYALDGGDLSDDDTSPSPTHRVRKPAVRNLASLSKTTPPGSPTRAPKAPDSPTTPLAPSPTRHEDEEVFIDSTQPTPTAALPTRSNSNDESKPESEPMVDRGGRDRDPSLEWYANAYSEAQLRTFHCEKVKKISLSGLDPSMLLGFMCRDEAEFEDFCERVSRLPHKIFTVQDEPPVWNDNDDAGLESVSEPDMDGDERGNHNSHNNSTFTASPPGVIRDDDGDDDDDDEEEEEEMLQDEFTTTTKNAIEIETDEKRLAASKAPAIATVENEDKRSGEGAGDASEGTEKKPRPPKPRPLQSMGPIGTDTQSWIRPTTSGQEAPNGRNVL